MNKASLACSDPTLAKLQEAARKIVKEQKGQHWLFFTLEAGGYAISNVYAISNCSRTVQFGIEEHFFKGKLRGKIAEILVRPGTIDDAGIAGRRSSYSLFSALENGKWRRGCKKASWNIPFLEGSAEDEWFEPLILGKKAFEKEADRFLSCMKLEAEALKAGRSLREAWRA